MLLCSIGVIYFISYYNLKDINIWELFDEIRANLSYNEIMQYLVPPVFDQKVTEGKLQIGVRMTNITSYLFFTLAPKS